MTLFCIVRATVIGGALSVVVAAPLTFAMLGLVKHLVSLSTGVLLGTALLHTWPETLESTVDPRRLFTVLLGGLLLFFLLDKAELYRHAHHHEGDGHGHGHHHHVDAEQAGRARFSVLVGHSIPNFCDGIIMAAAFIASPELGLTTSLAIILHDIPQEVGVTIVLINAGFSRRKALRYNALSGFAAVVGGVLGDDVLDVWQTAYSCLLVAPHALRRMRGLCGAAGCVANQRRAQLT